MYTSWYEKTLKQSFWQCLGSIFWLDSKKSTENFEVPPVMLFAHNFSIWNNMERQKPVSESAYIGLSKGTKKSPWSSHYMVKICIQTVAPFSLAHPVCYTVKGLKFKNTNNHCFEWQMLAIQPTTGLLFKWFSWGTRQLSNSSLAHLHVALPVRETGRCQNVGIVNGGNSIKYNKAHCDNYDCLEFVTPATGVKFF